MSERLIEVEAAIRAIKKQRDEDRADATKDNDRRHGEVMGGVGRVEDQLEEMNSTVRENRERIIVVETHQLRSKQDKDRAAHGSARVVEPPNVRAQIQWAALGGAVIVIVQNLSEAILALANFIMEAAS